MDIKTKQFSFDVIVTLFVSLLLFSINFSSYANNTNATPLHHSLKTYPAQYNVDILNDYLVMPDGIKLGITIYKPIVKSNDKKFPIIVEASPYRKDDYFYDRDFRIFHYMAARGIAGVRIDIRGTGASFGKVPEREYSDIELKDLCEAIDQLSKLDWSNGKIGMQGISWSSFNALMVTATSPCRHKKPDALLLLHGSEDIYANDIHNIDGQLHLDIFTQEIDTENMMPRSPNYEIDNDYWNNKFNSRPWIFTYLEHQRDSQFWSSRSLYTNYSGLNIPTYVIGGLLDGYRDYVISILDNVRNTFVKADIGPWNHDYPDTGAPGPNYNFLHSAVRWWKQTLTDENTGIMDEPKITLFMRNSIPANNTYETTPGYFAAFDNWPLPTKDKRYYLSANNLLSSTPPATSKLLPIHQSVASNIDAGFWWGDKTEAMPAIENGALIFDTTAFSSNQTIAGTPHLDLTLANKSTVVNVIARLEDIHPDGSISLITGGGRKLNNRINDRKNPILLSAMEPNHTSIPMRFTTYTLEKGHKLRLVISYDQFPMLWPVPDIVIGTLDTSNSLLHLPVLSGKKQKKSNFILKPDEEGNRHSNDYINLDNKARSLPPVQYIYKKNRLHILQNEQHEWKIKNYTFSDEEKVDYYVDLNNPALAGFNSKGHISIKMNNSKQIIHLYSKITVNSDKKFFHVKVTRKIVKNGTVLRSKTWKKDILRDIQ